MLRESDQSGKELNDQISNLETQLKGHNEAKAELSKSKELEKDLKE